MKRILLTGATGFIGRQCLPLLVERGYEVHAVSSKAVQGGARGGLWHRADLLDPDQTRKLVSSIRPTHLLHLAWMTEPGEYRISKKNFTWVRASLSLVEAVSRFGAKRVVIAGTCAEYDWRDGWCSEEATPLKPITPYGIAKHSLHQELEAFAAKTRLSAAWGRIFFAYGPHERPERFVPSMVLSLLKGQAAVCLHGALLRDFLHVSDIADAFVALLESEICGPVNIASGRPVSLREIATRIASELDGHHLMRFESAADTPDEPPLIAGNVHRLSRELGWSPRYDLNRGLAQTIEWWRRHLRGGGSSPTSTA